MAYNDPRWIVARWAGVDAKGLAYKKGENVFYYPKGKVILAGKNAEAEAESFNAMVQDEDTYNYGR